MRDLILFEEPTRNYYPLNDKLEFFDEFEGEFNLGSYASESDHRDKSQCSRCRKNLESLSLRTEWEQDFLDGHFDFTNEIMRETKNPIHCSGKKTTSSCFTLHQVKCHKTEDWSTDECLLKVYVDGVRKKTLRKKMKDGQVWQLSFQFSFNEKVVVRLWDEDWPDADDFIGSLILDKESTVGKKDFTATKNLRGHAAHYSIKYSVTHPTKGASVKLCKTNHGSELKPKINIARAVEANRTLSKSLGWHWAIDDITSKVLLTYLYKVEDAGLTQAVATWQQDNCFGKINGIIGKKEWNEIRHILAIHTDLSKIDIRKKKLLRYVNTLMPRGFFGICATKSPSHRYGLPETINALKKVGLEWWLENPTDPVIKIRDISKPYGSTSKWLTHGSHRMGIDVDIGLMRNDCLMRGVEISNKAYSQQRTQKLVNKIINNGVLKVHKIFFDDHGVTAPRGIITSDGVHKNHFHVRFCMPSKYDLTKMKKEAFLGVTSGIYKNCA